jgi:hypothetical protein
LIDNEKGIYMKFNFLSKACIALVFGVSAQFALALQTTESGPIQLAADNSCSISCDSGKTAACSSSPTGCNCTCS